MNVEDLVKNPAKYFAKPDSKPECFVRLDPPPFVGMYPNPEPSKTYRVQKDLSGRGKHRIDLWATDTVGFPVRT